MGLKISYVSIIKEYVNICHEYVMLTVCLNRFGQQWRSVAQRKKLDEASVAQTIFVNRKP